MNLQTLRTAIPALPAPWRTAGTQLGNGKTYSFCCQQAGGGCRNVEVVTRPGIGVWCEAWEYDAAGGVVLEKHAKGTGEVVGWLRWMVED